MKKSLIALAVMAVSGVAVAQSTVTLYGYGDLGYGKSIANGAKTQMNPGTADVGGLRIGLRGTEDLGGGLKASFQMESSTIAGDTGRTGVNNGKTYANGVWNGAAADETKRNDGGVDFARALWVGLSGGFGTVQIGRQTRPSVSALAGFSSSGWRGTAADINAGLVWAISPASRLSAATVYVSPTISGLTARVGYVTANESSAASGDVTSTTELTLNYGAGPLGLAVAYANDKGVEKSYAVSASYDLGVARVAGTYSDPSGASKGYALNVKAPMGATSLWAEYARNTASKVTSFELGADYALSKRTALTAAMNKTKAIDAGFYAGVRHSF